MRPLKYRPHYTVDDYQLWEGDWELIDGIPSAMSPSPFKRHQLLALAILNHISSALENGEKNCNECTLVYELDWIINDSTVVRPDIALICDKEGDFITKPPVLIVEVLSPSSTYKDRIVKSEIYSGHGVRYYIIADPDAKVFQTFILKDNAYTEDNTNAHFSIHPGCSVQLDLYVAMKKFIGN